MSTRFLDSLREAGWSTAGGLNQSRIHTDLVAAGSRTAFFLVDSLRYEMGVELREQLSDADELTLTAAVAAAPTITPLGMAALMPGAATSFTGVGRRRVTTELVSVERCLETSRTSQRDVPRHHGAGLRGTVFRRLGKGDQLVIWKRPEKPDWMDDATYQQMPETLTRLQPVRPNRLKPALRANFWSGT